MRPKRMFAKYTHAQVLPWLLLLFMVLYFVCAHEGIYYADDLSYSYYSALFAEGNFNFETLQGHTFIHRPAVYVPTAVLYLICGINAYTYTLWPFICTLAAVYILYRFSPATNQTEKVFSLLLLALSFYYLYFSNFLYPDNIVTFFAFAAALLIYWSRKRANHPIIAGLLVTVLLFIAFLAKETAAFYMPFFVGLAIYDVFTGSRKVRLLWASVLLSGLVIGALYLAFYYYSTGTPFQRFIEINEANYVYDNHVTQPNKPYLRRLLWSPIEVMISTGTFIPLVFMFGGKSNLDPDKLRTKCFWSYLFASGLAVLWFTSTSYTAYSPLSLDARMFNILLPPLAIAAAIGLERKLTNRKYSIAYGLIFTAAALYLYNLTSLPYLVLGTYFLVTSALQARLLRAPLKVTVAVLVLCFLLRPVYFMAKTKVLYYTEHHKIVSYLNSQTTNRGAILYAPFYFVKAVTYYRHFYDNPSIQTVHYNSLKHIGGSSTYLLINQKINSQTPFTESIDNKDALGLFKNISLVYKSGPLFLYKVD